jgi:hypothetical protein
VTARAAALRAFIKIVCDVPDDTPHGVSSGTSQTISGVPPDVVNTRAEMRHALGHVNAGGARTL